MMDLMLRQAQHEAFCDGRTLSLLKGRERCTKRQSKSGGFAKVTNAASLSERPGEAHKK
jgi:hypothetical protein